MHKELSHLLPCVASWPNCGLPRAILRSHGPLVEDTDSGSDLQESRRGRLQRLVEDSEHYRHRRFIEKTGRLFSTAISEARKAGRVVQYTREEIRSLVRTVLGKSSLCAYSPGKVLESLWKVLYVLRGTAENKQHIARP